MHTAKAVTLQLPVNPSVSPQPAAVAVVVSLACVARLTWPAPPLICPPVPTRCVFTGQCTVWLEKKRFCPTGLVALMIRGPDLAAVVQYACAVTAQLADSPA